MDYVFKRPLVFSPFLKSVIWGGGKIALLKDLDPGLSDIGESWELSAVPGHESVCIDDDDLAGLNLVQLVERYGADLMGTDVYNRWGNEFPLLIKIIDAKQNLSVQVHPDDALAAKRNVGRGKTEMWYIIDHEPDANIYVGLSGSLTPDEYVRRIADNSIMDVVAAHPSARGQFYFVPAGTIHAIGAGNLLAEVQQSSDTTYRVYDYDRRDAQGNPRELHTELAKDAIDYRFPNDIRPTAEVFGKTTRGAVHCDYFNVDYVKLDTSGAMKIDNGGRSFAVLIVTNGTMLITLADGSVNSYKAGTTVLLPASMAPCSVSGSCECLLVTC